MASSLCKITAAMAACIFLLALVLPPCSGQRSGCSEVGRSKTFQGDCHSDGGCADACRSEGYTDGYCFTNAATPDPICMCVAQGPPATTTRKTSSWFDVCAVNASFVLRSVDQQAASLNGVSV